MEDQRTTVDRPDERDLWQDDILDRRDFADFLTRVLAEQARLLSERQQRGLTVALDAEWGAGKTFFIERWAEDLRRQSFPVVMFDAWKHDLGEAPSIVLMAAIHEALRTWFGRATIQAETKERAREIGRQGIRHLRRAVLPTTGVVLSGLLKKATGIAWKDLKGAYTSADDEDDEADASEAEVRAADGDETADEDQTKIDAGLDRIFEKALGEQTQRIEAIENFRAEMARAIDLIRSEAAANMPVFVFVDELDRCRPSYAISLLEEIKHIFGMPQICFVVSTNLSQLSHSVRAVYGQGFDAEHYLKRFFDQTHVLPPRDTSRHVELLLSEHLVMQARKHATGIPRNNNHAKEVVDAIFNIFEACRLDLRSQKQVFRIAETAASAIPEEKNLYTLWLFFLAALVHKNQEAYFELVRKRLEPEEFRQLALQVMHEDRSIKHWKNGTIEEVKLSEVLKLYYKWANLNARQIHEEYNRMNFFYPQNNIEAIVEELPTSWRGDYPPSPLIKNYFEFVRYAGYVRNLSA
jgi:hypothetical protein